MQQLLGWQRTFKAFQRRMSTNDIWHVYISDLFLEVSACNVYPEHA